MIVFCSAGRMAGYSLARAATSREEEHQTSLCSWQTLLSLSQLTALAVTFILILYVIFNWGSAAVLYTDSQLWANLNQTNFSYGITDDIIIVAILWRNKSFMKNLKSSVWSSNIYQKSTGKLKSRRLIHLNLNVSMLNYYIGDLITCHLVQIIYLLIEKMWYFYHQA